MTPKIILNNPVFILSFTVDKLSVFVFSYRQSVTVVSSRQTNVSLYSGH